MLGKLAKELRMLGYDTIYYRGEDAHQLIQLARQEGRVILTRNTKLFPKKLRVSILRVTEDDPTLQLRELIEKRYISLDEETLFSDACSAIAASMRSHGRRQRGRSQTSSFTNRKHSSDVRSAEEFIGRDLTRRTCKERWKG